MPNSIRFGLFELDLAAAELLQNGRKVRLPEQQFQILQMLLLRQGGVLSREEIRKKLWPNDTVVEFDRSINAAIMKLRAALGDSAAEPRFIETLSRRGFRFLMPVEVIESKATEVTKTKIQQGSLVGQKVAHYRVLGVLGGGGMGLVYKAEDLKLNRPVALKFLPEELATDPVTLLRFGREARTASQLNHPNICTIYQVAEHGTQPFIVMELLEGETLRDVLLKTIASAGGEKHGLPLEQLLDVALQVAQGLDAAHQKGIIHRDIKPANVFVTTGGQVKILDFGLAKVAAVSAEAVEDPSRETDSDGSAPESVQPAINYDLSRTGVAMGTAGYMSPEQVRGEELDARTDLFSFGLILFEMATGQRAFGGETAAIVQDAILHQFLLPVRTLNPQLPLRLEEIICKALQKDRELRYRTASGMLANLNAVKADVGGSPHQVATPSPKETRRRTSVWVAAALAGVVSLPAIAYFVQTRRNMLPLENNRVLSVTHEQVSFLGDAYLPAISPDGRTVVYVTKHPGSDQKLMLQDLFAGGAAREISHAELYSALEWSPDGFEFMISQANGGEGKTFAFSMRGAAPRLVGDGDYYVCWLPGGTQYAKSYTNPEAGIWVRNQFTGEKNRIPAPAYERLDGLACSGKTGRLLLTTETSERYQIWSMNQDGTEQRRLIQGTSGAIFKSPRWSSAGDAIYFLREEKGTTDLMKLPVSGHSMEATVLVSGLQAGDSFTLSADGSKLAYTRSLSYSNLWMVELPTPESTPSDMALTTETWSYSDPVFSPDGRSFAYTMGSSQSTGNVWKMAVDGGRPVQLTFADAAGVWSPAWSPDGKRIAYITDQGGSTKVWIVSADGGDARPLEKTDASVDNHVLSWSPNPNIWYPTHDAHNLRSLNVETQEGKLLFPQDLKGWFMTQPVVSPDGKKMAIYWYEGHYWGASLFTLGSLTNSYLYRGAFPFGWSSDGGSLYAFSWLDGREIMQLKVGDSKKPRSVITMPGAINAATISPDGRRIIVSVGEEKSDVWLMKNFDPQEARAQ